MKAMHKMIKLMQQMLCSRGMLMSAMGMIIMLLFLMAYIMDMGPLMDRFMEMM